MRERESIESMRLFKPRVAMVLGWATLASLVVLALFGLWCGWIAARRGSPRRPARAAAQPAASR